MTSYSAIAARRTGVPVLAPGHVWLAGAGPGDPGLLTLDALAGLAQADVVVHDALVDRRVLALAGEQARLEFAGKRGGRPSAVQADISQRLIELARAGERVLRLKGGDPFVFGRGGEEAMALAAAGVPFRVIPGVTAGLAALSRAAIPATLRGVNRAVIFATGHGEEERVRLGPARAHRPADRHLHGDASPRRDRGRADARRLAARHAGRRDRRGDARRGTHRGLDARTHRRRGPRRADRPPAIVVVGEIVAARERLLGIAAAAAADQPS